MFSKVLPVIRSKYNVVKPLHIQNMCKRFNTTSYQGININKISKLSKDLKSLDNYHDIHFAFTIFLIFSGSLGIHANSQTNINLIECESKLYKCKTDVLCLQTDVEVMKSEIEYLTSMINEHNEHNKN